MTKRLLDSRKKGLPLYLIGLILGKLRITVGKLRITDRKLTEIRMHRIPPPSDTGGGFSGF